MGSRFTLSQASARPACPSRDRLHGRARCKAAERHCPLPQAPSPRRRSPSLRPRFSGQREISLHSVPVGCIPPSLQPISLLHEPSTADCTGGTPAITRRSTVFGQADTNANVPQRVARKSQAFASRRARPETEPTMAGKEPGLHCHPLDKTTGLELRYATSPCPGRGLHSWQLPPMTSVQSVTNGIPERALIAARPHPSILGCPDSLAAALLSFRSAGSLCRCPFAQTTLAAERSAPLLSATPKSRFQLPLDFTKNRPVLQCIKTLNSYSINTVILLINDRCFTYAHIQASP
jgi:hypothetical protein